MWKKAQRIGFLSPDFCGCLVKLSRHFTPYGSSVPQGLNNNLSLSLTLLFMPKWLTIWGGEVCRERRRKKSVDGKVPLK